MQYPKYVQPVIIAVQAGSEPGDYGNDLCSQADAESITNDLEPYYSPSQLQEIKSQLAAPFEITLVNPTQEQIAANIGWWVIPTVGKCQDLIRAKNSNGVGAPGYWADQVIVDGNKTFHMMIWKSVWNAEYQQNYFPNPVTDAWNGATKAAMAQIEAMINA